MSIGSLNRAALWAGLALVVCVSLGGNCSNGSGGVDAGPDVGGGTGGDGGSHDGGVLASDGGTADTGPVAQPCYYDDDCGPTERCSDILTCVPAVACDGPANCTPSDDNDVERAYCENATVGLGCRCVIPAGGTEGYCKRRLPACAPCTSDEQCGTDPLYFKTPLHETGKCVSLGGTKVCLESFGLKCGCGQSVTIDGKAYCAPQGDPISCLDDSGKPLSSFLCCTKDANCPAEHPLCNTATGVCKDVCWYDYAKQETVGCRADQVCHVDPDFLTPTSRNYGAGRCGPPCAADGECTQRGDFVCRAEAKSGKRCRPPGCIDDLECPTTDSGSPYMGYCDRGAGVCVCKDVSCNCRTGSDPITSLPFVDCKEGFKCEEPTPGADGQCLEKNCIESGGAQNFCGWNQFCCGEDRDGDPLTPVEPCTDPAGTVLAQRGKCYDIPNPPWCAACDDQNIKSCTKNGWPTSTKDANYCVDFGTGARGTERGPMCLFACAQTSQCPKGFVCREMIVDCTSDGTACGDATRCTGSGRFDNSTNPPTEIKYCKCSTAGAKGGECPIADPNTPDGPSARCSDAVLNSTHSWNYCIWNKGCQPLTNGCVPPATP